MPKNLTEGFPEHYRPSQKSIEAVFDTGVIVLDTNVLLNVLRYSPEARTELLDVLESIASRCFIPHQVALEFNRNRVTVVHDRQKELAELRETQAEIRASALGLIKRYNTRQILTPEDLSRLSSVTDKFLEELDEHQGNAESRYDIEPDEMVGHRDAFTSKLEDIFDSRVGDAPDTETLELDLLEAERRREERIAPGFKDNPNGDYLWWAEVLRHPDLKGKGILVISDDATKEDWRHKERGFWVGPLPQLQQDVSAAGGDELILLTTQEFLKFYNTREPNSVSDETLAESGSRLDIPPTEWNEIGFDKLLDYLRSDNYADRADVILTAARNGGFISREEIFDILDIEEGSRSLKQYVTPVWRMTTILQREGLVPAGAQDALWAEYDGPGRTVGYSVPEEFTRFVSPQKPSFDSSALLRTLLKFANQHPPSGTNSSSPE